MPFLIRTNIKQFFNRLKEAFSIKLEKMYLQGGWMVLFGLIWFDLVKPSTWVEIEGISSWIQIVSFDWTCSYPCKNTFRDTIRNDKSYKFFIVLLSKNSVYFLPLLYSRKSDGGAYVCHSLFKLMF